LAAQASADGAKGAMLPFAIRLTAIAQFTFTVLVTPSLPQAADPSQADGTGGAQLKNEKAVMITLRSAKAGLKLSTNLTRVQIAFR
jgi:hypothetical protein